MGKHLRRLLENLRVLTNQKTVYGGGDDNSDMLIYEKNLLNKFAKNIIIEDLIQCLKYYLK